MSIASAYKLHKVQVDLAYVCVWMCDGNTIM